MYSIEWERERESECEWWVGNTCKWFLEAFNKLLFQRWSGGGDRVLWKTHQSGLRVKNQTWDLPSMKQEFITWQWYSVVFKNRSRKSPFKSLAIHPSWSSSRHAIHRLSLNECHRISRESVTWKYRVWKTCRELHMMKEPVLYRVPVPNTVAASTR